MTVPAIPVTTVLDAKELTVDRYAQLGNTAGAFVGFFGQSPKAQSAAPTAPAVNGDAPAVDLPSVIALANGLQATVNNNASALSELRNALGDNITGVGLVNI